MILHRSARHARALRRPPAQTSFTCFARHASSSTVTQHARTGVMDVSETSPLVMQDPLRRIRFALPVRYGWTSGSTGWETYYAKQQFPTAVRVEPFVLPFWIVYFTFDASASSYVGPNIPAIRYPDARQISHIPLALPAVPDTHWAAGVVLNDGLQHYLPGSRFNLAPGGAWPDTPACYYYPGYNSSIVPFLGDGPNASQPIEPFAFSYPKLSPLQQELVLQAMGVNIGGKGVKDIYQIHSFSTHGFPTYRPVYRVTLPDGSFGLIDPHRDGRDSIKPAAFLIQRQPGRVLTRWDWNESGVGLDDDVIPTSIRLHERDRDRMDGSLTREIVFYAVPRESSIHVAELVTKAMRSSPINWDDPHILPLSHNHPRPNTPYDGDAFMRYAIESHFDRTVQPPVAFSLAESPTARQVAAQPTLRLRTRPPADNAKLKSTTDRNPKRTTDARMKSTTEGQPESTTDAKPKSTADAQASSSSTADPPPSSAKPSEAKSAPTSGKATRRETLASQREARLEEFLKKQRAAHEAYQAKWGASGGSDPSAPPSPRRSYAPAGMPVDRAGHYRTLGVALRRSLLEEKHEKDVNEEIGRKYRELSMIAHPDVGGEDDEQVKLNVAYHHIRDLKRRRAYHEKRK